MNKKVLKRFFFAFLIYLGLNIIVSSLIGEILQLFNIKDGIFIDLGMLIASIITLIALVVYSKDLFKGKLKDFLNNIKKYIPNSLKTWIVGFLLMALANLIINLLLLHGIAPNEETNREILGLYPIYSIIYMCILGPITEEIVFRLNLDELSKEKYKYILFSGILFGGLHVLTTEVTLSSLIYIIPYSILGLSFAKIYSDTDNIYSSIFIHILHNTLSILVILLGV